MNRKDLLQLLWMMPFLGAFAALILAALFQAGGAAMGIMVMLGALAGSITMISYIMVIHYTDNEENKDTDNSPKA